MNIIDAIKSGRPFRASCFKEGWYWWISGGQLVAGPYPDVHPDFSKTYVTLTDLQADYETQEPTVTITASQFWDAMNNCVTIQTSYRYIGVEDLARRLGLEPK